MESVSRLPRLRLLNVSNSPVTDAGLASLEKCTSLVDLKASGTKVTAAGVAKLQKAAAQVQDRVGRSESENRGNLAAGQKARISRHQDIPG